MRLQAIPAALAAALGATGTAAAQTVPEEAVELAPVTVESTRVRPPASGAAPRTDLGGDELRHRLGSTLGATVQEEPGVANASFGPGVGVPVIRGLTGSRVRTLVDGIGSHDASTVSPDHAVSVEPVLARAIRILRGPAVVRYGGGAIGGLVEVDEGRILEELPEGGAAGLADLRYNFNGAEKTGAGRVDLGAGTVGLHLDGFGRTRNNVSIPGFAIDEAAVFEQFGLRNEENSYGFIPNSDARARGGGAGLSVVGSYGFAGFSASTLRNDYGIPPAAHSHDHGDGAGEDVVRIDMKQSRYDFKSALRWQDGWARELKVRVGKVDYRHDEVDNGVPVTTFNNDVTEGRVELDHRWSEAASGTLGFQGLDRDFSALGDEAFVPVTQQRGHGLFAIERLDLGPVLLEAGARIERQRARPQPQETVFGTTITLPDRDFIAHSYSASATWRVAERAELAIAYQRAQRPPDVQELYSLGPHLATRTFDVGNPQLAVETLSGVDLGGYGDFGWGTARANVYRYSGKDFIYQENTGIFYDLEEELFRARCVTLDECLPVVRYDQRGARLYGYEAELMFRLGEVASGAAELTLFGDLVRGRFKEGDDIPRLPPPRYGAQLAWFGERLAMRVRVTRGEPQNRPGANETPTAGYVLLNASAQYTLGAQGMEWVFYLVGRNLLDREIRNSTSFLRNLAPEPGRSIEVGVQARF